MSIARTTPAQNPRGLRRRTRLVTEVTSGTLVTGSRMVAVTLQVYRFHPNPTSDLHQDWFNRAQYVFQQKGVPRPIRPDTAPHFVICDLKPCGVLAGGMPAVAGKSGKTLRIFAEVRTIFRSGFSHATTGVVGTFLRFRHRYPPKPSSATRARFVEIKLSQLPKVLPIRNLDGRNRN